LYFLTEKAGYTQVNIPNICNALIDYIRMLLTLRSKRSTEPHYPVVAVWAQDARPMETNIDQAALPATSPEPAGVRIAVFHAHAVALRFRGW
jgi:hypothetical protein